MSYWMMHADLGNHPKRQAEQGFTVPVTSRRHPSHPTLSRDRRALELRTIAILAIVPMSIPQRGQLLRRRRGAPLTALSDASGART